MYDRRQSHKGDHQYDKVEEKGKFKLTRGGNFEVSDQHEEQCGVEGLRCWRSDGVGGDDGGGGGDVQVMWWGDAKRCG